MPEQKFAASDANAAQLHRDGSDIGHAASHDAGHKLSQEAADLMRAQQTRGGKPKHKTKTLIAR